MGLELMARKLVRNFAIDQDLVDQLERESATRGKSMSMIVREALQLHFGAARAGMN
jgi:hypothetical protein